MALKHRINIQLSRGDGSKQSVLQGGEKTVRSRFLSKLIGERVGILLLTPGDSVGEVSIQEVSRENNIIGQEKFK